MTRLSLAIALLLLAACQQTDTPQPACCDPWPPFPADFLAGGRT